MTITPTMIDPSQKEKRIDLLKGYLETRHQSLNICKPLQVDDYGSQPITEVSPPKWHLAHTTWFFETMILKVYSKNYRPFNEGYNYLFNSYYNGIGQQFPRDKRGTLSRPTLAEVIAYRGHVDEAMIRLLSFDQPKQLTDLVVLGCHHEQQHQELLAYDIKYILGTNPLFPAYEPKADKVAQAVADLSYAEQNEGLQEIGFEGNGFHFDNEAPRHKVYLREYQIAERLTTNGEYLAFIEAGGYDKPEFWLSDGWAWQRENPIKHPLYWVQRDGAWFEYQLNGGLLPLDLNRPVMHVSYYEADAFAAWSGKRLPTEAEWEVYAQTKSKALAEVQEEPQLLPHAARLFRNVWQWTSSDYAPYPGFKPFGGAAAEYNGKFMCNQLVLRGGSFATPAGHARVSYRNFFFPADRWQFSGIRLAHSE